MRWLAVAIVLIMKHSCVLAANIDNRNAQEFEKEDSLKPSPKGPVGLVLTQLYANNLQENSSQKKSQVILGDYDSNYGELLETIGFDMRNITMIEVQLKNPFKHGLSTREKFIFDSGMFTWLHFLLPCPLN